jgi:hypothetical protein
LSSLATSFFLGDTKNMFAFNSEKEAELVKSVHGKSDAVLTTKKTQKKARSPSNRRKLD